MDMNKVFFLKKEIDRPRWQVVDANKKVIGRLATQIADMLRGKDLPTYTPHCAPQRYIVVINADKAVFTGDKMRDKRYEWYTGWIGGLKSLTAEQMVKKDPTSLIRLAVKGMLPKTKQSDALLRRLKIYVGDQHPHHGQFALQDQPEKAAPAA
jgi:large subunit ribosomal protein L13